MHTYKELPIHNNIYSPYHQAYTNDLLLQVQHKFVPEDRVRWGWDSAS